jgi:ketosteroid isomerase-like protein
MLRAIILLASQDSIGRLLCRESVPRNLARVLLRTIVRVTKAETEDTLRAAYAAFNARDVGAAVELMHPEVDWPNAWEGGRVAGRAAVAAYWTRQFESISSTVEPERFDHESDGSVTVAVHQVVRDPKTNEVQSDTHVLHRYWLEDDLIRRMVVLDAAV